MFNLSLVTQIILVILFIGIIIYFNNTEHFTQKKKKIHIMKVKKPSKNIISQPTNANFNKDKKYHGKEHHVHHYYDYNYPNYWYEYLYPKNWGWSWWGYPSEYDPNLSVPYLNEDPIINLDDNCHKKCADRYENESDTEEYLYKVHNCINDYCY